MKTTHLELLQQVAARLREIKEADPKANTLMRLAKEGGISYGSIRNILDGRNVTTRILHGAAKAVGMSVSEFAAENGEMAELSQNEREIVKAYRVLKPDMQETFLKQVTQLAALVRADEIAKLRRSELGLLDLDSQSHEFLRSRKNQ